MVYRYMMQMDKSIVHSDHHKPTNMIHIHYKNVVYDCLILLLIFHFSQFSLKSALRVFV